MAFCSLFRNRTLSLRASRLLTSNLEVLEEIPTINQPSLSEIDTVKINKYQRIGYSREHVNRINEYFNSKPSLRVLKEIIPSSYFLKKPTIKTGLGTKMFLVDKDVACDILKALQPYIQTYNGQIMEVNAGAGVLTEEFLKAELRNLRIYEPDAMLCNHILKLIKHYKSDARLFMANMLALGGMIRLDREDNKGRLETLFDGLPSLKWEDEPVVKLIGALRDERFILHIMFSIILQTGICKHGRPELFFIFSPSVYEKLTSKPSEEKLYRSNAVIFQILFDHEVLLRVPDYVFIPWCQTPKPKKGKNQHKEEESCNDLCLVKISPKKDLLQTIPPDLLKSFWYFVKILMRKKSSLLFDKIEKWVPGSGVRLISLGYTIFTDCGSLTPDEYLKIYLEFSSWPEYHHCSFQPHVDGMLSKVLQYSLVEQEISDEKFGLLNKESNDSEDDVDVFDGSANLEHVDKSLSVEERDR